MIMAPEWSAGSVVSAIRGFQTGGRMRTFFVGVGLVAWLAAGLTTLSAADRTSIELKSAHFTLVSDAGDKPARTILWELEQVRAAVATFWPWARTDLGRPILVLVTRDEGGMRSLAPRYWEEKNSVRPASVFVSAPDRYFVALRADVKADDKGGVINPYRTAYWSYLVLALRASGYRQLPLWFSLGLTELMSNTIVRETHLEIGRPIPWHVQRVREHFRLPVRDLLQVTNTSPWYVRDEQRPDLDAECWALVHYLMFADEGAHCSQLDRFAQLVVEGKTPDAASALVFPDVAAIESGLVAYINRSIFMFAKANVDMGLKRETFASRSLTVGETAVAQAAWHSAMGRPVEARNLVDAAKKSEPRLAGAYEVDGRLSDAERKSEDARRAYGQAIELGSTDFYSHYRWAALTVAATTVDVESQKRADKALEDAIKLNDRFAPTYAVAAGVRMDLGRRDEALTLAQRGVVLDPGGFENRFTLARVFWSLQRRTEASREAREALALSLSEDQRRAAQQLIDFFQKNTPP